MAKKETKALIKRGTTEVSTDVKFNPELLGASKQIDQEDILIPKIWLMQSMSKLVQDAKAKVGEFRNSIDGELIAGVGEGIDLIVFDSYKSWQIFEIDKKGKSNYLSTLDFYNGNENLAINEELPSGQIIHRDKVLGFYCLLLKEVMQGSAFPYIVDFKRTSRMAGQNLTTKFAKLLTIGLPSYAKIFNLTATTQKNEHGTFFVKEISTGRNIEQDEVAAVEKWIVTISKARAQGKLKVDDTDVRNENMKNVTEGKINKDDKF